MSDHAGVSGTQDPTCDHLVMTAYLVPIDGLTLTEPWQLGAVTLRDADGARALITAQHPLAGQAVRDFADGLTGVVGHVSAETIDEATDLITTALDVLRVFQQATAVVQTTMFGLPGDVLQSRVDYLALEDEVKGAGWKHRGQHLGSTFDSQRHGDFRDSGFAFAAAAIGQEAPSEGELRALLGLELASRAILEHRPPLRLLSAVMAAEAMLLDRSKQPQALRLARRSVYLLCEGPEQSLCGRDRPTCLYLAHSPETNGGREGLRELRARGNTDTRWRCSEWHQVMDWYDARSGVAHGGAEPVDEEEASRVVFWLANDLVPAMLTWLAEHPADPLANLESAIAALPDPPDWEALIAEKGDSAAPGQSAP